MKWAKNRQTAFETWATQNAHPDELEQELQAIPLEAWPRAAERLRQAFSSEPDGHLADGQIDPRERSRTGLVTNTEFAQIKATHQARLLAFQRVEGARAVVGAIAPIDLVDYQ